MSKAKPAGARVRCNPDPDSPRVTESVTGKKRKKKKKRDDESEAGLRAEGIGLLAAGHLGQHPVMSGRGEQRQWVSGYAPPKTSENSTLQQFSLSQAQYSSCSSMENRSHKIASLNELVQQKCHLAFHDRFDSSSEAMSTECAISPQPMELSESDVAKTVSVQPQHQQCSMFTELSRDPSTREQDHCVVSSPVESLRWEQEYSDDEKERKRIEIYKANRRKRYQEALDKRRAKITRTKNLTAELVTN